VRSTAGALRRVCRGFELDPDAASAAEYILAVATKGVGRGGLPEVVQVRNALLEGFDEGGGPWDIILMNPPYVGEKFLRHRLGRSVQDELRQQDGFAGDLLVHFVFRGLRSLREGGVLAAIVSDTAFTMESATRMRALLLEDARPLSIAWCRPFRSAAVQGGIITAQRAASAGSEGVTCYSATGRSSIELAESVIVPASSFRRVPGRPIYRPTEAAVQLAERWSRIPAVEDLWSEVLRRGSTESLANAATSITPGAWTLLGVLVRGGQGIATGDDRRFVGFLAGSPEAERAIGRQQRIMDALRSDPARKGQWRELKHVLASGAPLQDGLLHLLAQRDHCDGEDLPERKPFRVVDPRDVRSGPLSAAEAQAGIVDGPSWVRYVTGDRTTSGGGGTWLSNAAAVIDWSTTAVELLRERRDSGYRRPVLRNADLWFRTGVAHNRISSYLRARLVPSNCLFSSESPVYQPRGNHLDHFALLALLNSPVVEFVVKTFLATRNHIEVGHVLRVPVPALDAETSALLGSLGRAAMERAEVGDEDALQAVEQEIDEVSRDLYELSMSIALTVVR
jgi:Eco57I restriction-modification methylase